MVLGEVPTARDAESIGLIVTELVINSLKHAFKETYKGWRDQGCLRSVGTDWQLAVPDNGCGKPDGVFAQPKTGLGTGVVKALAKQLDAQVVTAERTLWERKFRSLMPRLQPRDLIRPPPPLHL